MLWKQPSGQPDGAQDICGEGLAGPTEFGLDESVVKAGIVGHEDAALQPRGNLGQQRLEARCALDHGLRDTSERLNFRGDEAIGVDQRGPLLDELVAIDEEDADLGDAVIGGADAAGFEVDEGVTAWSHPLMIQTGRLSG